MKESWKKKTKTSSAIFEVTEKDILQSCSRLSRCGSWEIFRVFGFDTKWQQVLRLCTIRVLVLGEIAPCLCAQAIGFAPWPACPVCHNTIFGALLIVADSSVMVRIAIPNTADERGRGTCSIIIKCFWILLKDSWISLNLLSRTLKGRTIRILPSHPRNPHATGLSSLALPSQSFPPFACQKWFSFLRDWLGCRTLRIPCCSLQNDLWTWMRQRLAKDATYFFAPAASKSWLPAPFSLLVHKLYENFTSYNLVFSLLVGTAPRILWSFLTSSSAVFGLASGIFTARLLFLVPPPHVLEHWVQASHASRWNAETKSTRNSRNAIQKMKSRKIYIYILCTDNTSTLIYLRKQIWLGKKKKYYLDFSNKVSYLWMRT